MQPGRENAAQPQQPAPFSNRNQYYEIGQSTMSLAESVRQSESLSAAPAHLHPINLCSSSTIISQQQLQEMLPGAVFGDPSLAHLHYHIVPSRRVIGNCSEQMSPAQQVCRSHRPVGHCDSHYQRHSQIVRPMLRSAPSVDDLDKERDWPISTTFDNLTRYSHLERNDKMKNMSLVELNSNESQASMTESKGKCQCHILHEHNDLTPQRQAILFKRDLDMQAEDQSSSSLNRQPPALPPRPPPRPASRHYELPSTSGRDRGHVASEGYRVCCKKYVVLCWLCGGLSVAVGSLFLLIHAVLSANTASLALFETVPSYIPGTMLIFIGLCTMLLARRKHRYGSLMKICGSVSIVCALVCVLVTVTTTVVHMSRLQSLHECVYTTRAKLCTCYSASQSHGTDQGVLFEGTPHCDAVHGALYTCLRTLFGVSVAGILACIFSCMLVYQLHRHEKKKMYWEQLELRCRSLYGQGAAAAAAGLVGAGRPAGTCGCCNDCGGIGPWWAQSPGNLYTPNPDLTPARRWRLPWSRSRGPAPSTDSNYGFQQSSSGVNTSIGNHHQSDGILDNAGMVPYGILGPAQTTGPYSVLQAAVHDDHHYGQGNPGPSPYSVLEAAVPLWGPPPPYSDPNSPARRFVYRAANEHRSRASKRIDSFPLREVEYNRSSDIKRQGNNNYENAEPLSAVSNDTDTESGEARVTRTNKHKKLLKGVENAAFQEQESNAMSKQSESELYFGDVSSCCGPESSLYDVATDKGGKNLNHQSEASTSYLSSQHKRPSSKRSRHQQQQPQQPIDLLDLPSNSSCSSHCDEAGGTSYAMHTAADIEYEVIREDNRYDYEAPGASYVPETENVEGDEEQVEQIERRNEILNDEEEAYGGDKEVDGSKEEDNNDDEEFGEFRSSFHEDVRPVKV